jgi:hypothetical protein
VVTVSAQLKKKTSSSRIREEDVVVLLGKVATTSPGAVCRLQRRQQ